jgi:hypothetical protein
LTALIGFSSTQTLGHRPTHTLLVVEAKVEPTTTRAPEVRPATQGTITNTHRVVSFTAINSHTNIAHS